MSQQFPLSAQLPFVPPSVAFAMRKAKHLRTQFPSLTLGRAREAFSRAVAFKDWHAMEQAISSGILQGTTDNLLTPAGRRARATWQAQALAQFLGLPESEIVSFLQSWNPTGPARSARDTTSKTPARKHVPHWDPAMTYQAAVQLDGLTPLQRARLELTPWPVVRDQFAQMPHASQLALDLPLDRCRLLTAKVFERRLPIKKSFFRMSGVLGDDTLDVALCELEALGVYLALLPPAKCLNVVARLQKAGDLPGVSRLLRDAEYHSQDIERYMSSILARTWIPERIEGADTEQLMWLDKAWHGLKTELGDEAGARAWVAMTGLTMPDLLYVRDWFENTPGRIPNHYSISDEQYRQASLEFDTRVRDSGSFLQQYSWGESAFSEWLSPTELDALLEGVVKDVISHGVFSVGLLGAAQACRNGDARIQLSLEWHREFSTPAVRVDSVVCDKGVAEKLVRAGWPFSQVNKPSQNTANFIAEQTGMPVEKMAYHLRKRKTPEHLE